MRIGISEVLMSYFTSLPHKYYSLNHELVNDSFFYLLLLSLADTIFELLTFHLHSLPTLEAKISRTKLEHGINVMLCGNPPWIVLITVLGWMH